MNFFLLLLLLLFTLQVCNFTVFSGYCVVLGCFEVFAVQLEKSFGSFNVLVELS